jgi:hypothetical protein
MKEGEIIFLLGAGASYEAGIPISSAMIEKTEKLIAKGNTWDKFANLYYCLKSAIKYGLGIVGKDDNENINIEILVNTMDELIKSYEHPIYPFVGSWTPRLSELAGKDFEEIKKLRKNIIEELSKNWMYIEHNEKSAYYKKLSDFQKEYGHNLHIFSLNYDKCVENQCAASGINRDFDNNHIWNYKNFDFDNKESNIILYKLHGSVDWNRKEGIVKEKDNMVPADELAVIFGTSYKLQYLDPFLYLVYEFRRQTLEPDMKVICCIGYSFNDDHINGILGQALKSDNSKKIIAVGPVKVGIDDINNEKEMILNKLNIDNSDNIIIENNGAKNYFENILSIRYFDKFLRNNDVPF